jgi:hypothetical protein
MILVKKFAYWIEVYYKKELIFSGASIDAIDLVDIFRSIGRKAEIKFHMNSGHPFRIDFSEEDRDE